MYSERAAEILEDLSRTYPDVLQYQSDLAHLCMSMGDFFHDRGRWVQAEANQRRALKLWKKLVRAQPDRLEFGAHLGSSYRALGRLATDRGDHRSAYGWFDRAIGALQAVLRRDPQYKQARQYLHQAYGSRARVLARLGRDAEAIVDWDRALGLIDEASPDWPRYRSYRARALARLGVYGRATAEAETAAAIASAPLETMYQAACAFALASAKARVDAGLDPAERQRRAEQYATRAIALLAKAREAGWFKNPVAREQLDKDRDGDLSSLRLLPDHRALLDDLAFPDWPFAP
jgi:tetratricopeptide (TPR) repeat protein